jgi:DNA replication licensing factor MCM2
MLRKYILYARTYVNPVMNAQTLDTRKVETFYATLRKASQHTGAVPIAVRHIESLFRMAEAYARLHLRDSVQNEDIDFAISVLTEALCNAQKASFRRQWRRLFRPYLTFRQDNNALLHHILAECFQSARMYAQLKNRTESHSNRKNITTETYKVLMSEFRDKAKQMGILDIGQYLQSDIFQNDGYHIDNDNGTIVKAV